MRSDVIFCSPIHCHMLCMSCEMFTDDMDLGHAVFCITWQHKCVYCEETRIRCQYLEWGKKQDQCTLTDLNAAHEFNLNNIMLQLLCSRDAHQSPIAR